MAKKRRSTSHNHKASPIKNIRRFVNTISDKHRRIENALNAVARLEIPTRRLRPRIYKNFNNAIDKPIKRIYNPFVLNLKTEKDVCRERKARREQIMRVTRGRGLRIKKATWSPSSFIVCS